MDQIHMFLAPEAEKIQSYLITLIDGTGSMCREYRTIVKAHEDSFAHLENNQLKFQWESVRVNGKVMLYDFLPFRSASQGNISGSFYSLFEILLDKEKKIPKNITIVFVSDGQEPYEFLEISQQIEQMKQKYEIQFISVAVGDSFPNTISNHLRQSIHNQNSSCRSLFSVERNYCFKKAQVYELFVEVFREINTLLNVSTKLVVDVPVYPYLQFSEPTNLIAPSEPFLVQGPITQVKIGSQQIKETQNIETLVRLTENSVKQQLILTPSDKQENIQKAFQEIEKQASKLFEQSQEQVQDQATSYQMAANLDLISSVAYGEIDLKRLQEQQMTELQVAYKPEILFKTLDNFQEKQKLNPIITPEQQQKKTKAKLNQIQGGCYVRCKTTNKQLDLIQSIHQVVFNSLKEQRKILETNTNNGKEMLINFRDMVFNFLANLFEQSQNKFDDQQLITIRKINDILELFDCEVASNESIIELIDTALSYNTQNWNIPELYTYKDFQYLPSQIWSFINQEKVKDFQSISFISFIDNTYFLILNFPRYFLMICSKIENYQQCAQIVIHMIVNFLACFILQNNICFYILITFTDYFANNALIQLKNTCLTHNKLVKEQEHKIITTYFLIMFALFLYYFFSDYQISILVLISLNIFNVLICSQLTDIESFQENLFLFFIPNTSKILKCFEQRMLCIKIKNEFCLYIIETIFIITQFYFVKDVNEAIKVILKFLVVFSLALSYNFQKPKLKLT